MQTAILSILLVLAQAPRGANNTCDRSCLAQFMTQYLDALVAHKPESVPVAPTMKFTEDTQTLKLGEGLWKTASKLTPYRQDFIDVRQGVIGTHVLIDENGKDIMYVVRLKVAANKITEIETQVTRSAADGMLFELSTLKAPTAGMNVVPTKAQLNSRADMIRIAEVYPSGLKAGSFVSVDLQVAPTAYRLENGRKMAGPGCTLGPGCEDLKTQPIPKLSEMKWRVVAVDEEMGVVWLRLDFGAGSLMGANAATHSLIPFEAFKIYDGKIQAVEAFMKALPRNTPSGWDAQ